MEGYPRQEAAQILGITKGAVFPACPARSLLRELLKEEIQ